MEQARDDLAIELASGTPNYSNAVAGAIRYCPLISHVLRSLEQAVSNLGWNVLKLPWYERCVWGEVIESLGWFSWCYGAAGAFL